MLAVIIISTIVTSMPFAWGGGVILLENCLCAHVNMHTRVHAHTPPCKP